MFFAPSHVQKRTKDWGPAGFDEKVSAFMTKASARSRDWMTISPLNGLEALTEIYPDVSAGRISGKQGLVVVLSPI